MAEIEQDTVFRIPLKSVGDFAKEHGTSNTAIQYNMVNDNIDYVKVGRFRLVVMTEKTLAYNPNLNKNRK